jgi:hypothetical protein
LPSKIFIKFHPSFAYVSSLSSSFLQDIANQVSSKNSSIFFLCNSFTQISLLGNAIQVSSIFHPSLAFMSLNLENFARQCHPSFIHISSVLGLYVSKLREFC